MIPEAVRSTFSSAQSRLEELVAVPGISATGYPAEQVRASAEVVAQTLLDYGLQSVRLLETAGHPAVYGEIQGHRDFATVLIYGHHDVQPPGRQERWVSPPFQATVRDGRIYGRGTADDKGGFLAYLHAAGCLLQSGALPCNIKILIEGEEETGSPHLPDLLGRERTRFASDFIVLCDTPNFDTGVPALTWRLRGNSIVDVEVRCLRQPVHSGQGGGLVPDSAMILCSMLASLQREDGTLDIPGLEETVEADPRQLSVMRDLPFEPTRVRENFGMLETAPLMAESWVDLWARPSLTITALESVPLAQAANQISERAGARLSLRTVRGIDSRAAGDSIAKALRAAARNRAEVEVKILGGPSWWEADPSHPVMSVARRALRKAFGADVVLAGSGGSVGFVKPFADLSPGIPPLLTGVQDPHSRAHSENESLHLGDWEKAMAGACYLLEDLAVFYKEPS